MENKLPRRVCLTLATLTMVAGGFGMAASFLFLGSSRLTGVTAGSTGFVAGSILLGCGLVALTLLIARSPHPEDTPFMRAIARCMFISAIMAGPTVLLFAPLWGFHHEFVFGILCYMVSDGYEVWIDPVRLSITIALWMALLGALLFVTRNNRSATPNR